MFQEEGTQADAAAIDVPTSPDPVLASSDAETLSPSRSRGNTPPRNHPTNQPPSAAALRNPKKFQSSFAASPGAGIYPVAGGARGGGGGVVGEVVMPQGMATGPRDGDRVMGQTFGSGTQRPLPGQVGKRAEGLEEVEEDYQDIDN